MLGLPASGPGDEKSQTGFIEKVYKRPNADEAKYSLPRP